MVGVGSVCGTGYYLLTVSFSDTTIGEVTEQRVLLPASGPNGWKWNHVECSDMATCLKDFSFFWNEFLKHWMICKENSEILTVEITKLVFYFWCNCKITFTTRKSQHEDFSILCEESMIRSLGLGNNQTRPKTEQTLLGVLIYTGKNKEEPFQSKMATSSSK